MYEWQIPSPDVTTDLSSLIIVLLICILRCVHIVHLVFFSQFWLLQSPSFKHQSLTKYWLSCSPVLLGLDTLITS